jgi:hypothetical protein
MRGFSRIVLESTLELAVEAMPPDRDARVTECVEVIHRYLDRAEPSSPDDEEQIRSVVAALLDISLQHHQYLISGRLEEIALQLEEPAA